MIFSRKSKQIKRLEKELRHTERRWARVVQLKERYNNRDFVCWRYKEIFGVEPDLENPVSLREKIQWMKLHYNNPLYAKCADKYLVREYIEQKGHGAILNELLGVYGNANDIDFDSLPERFVIKATHGCGWNLICKDKEALREEWPLRVEIMNHWLRQDYSLYGRELHYTYITPRLVVEKFLENEDGSDIADYKIFCFDGEPKLIEVIYSRYGEDKRNFHYPDWSLSEIKFPHIPNKLPIDEKPEKLDEMLEIAKELSAGFPLVRVDLYQVRGKIYFGEFTFTSGNGLSDYEPADALVTMGNWMTLPDENSPFVVK